MVYITEAHPSDVWQMQSNVRDKVVYTGWPDRIYLVDQNGRVAYKSKPGPFGFKSEELSYALARVVPN